MTKAKYSKILALLVMAPVGGLASTISDSINIEKSKFDNTKLEAVFSSRYINQESKLNKAKSFQLRAGFDLSQKVSDTLKFDLDASLKMENGSSNSLYNNNEFNARNDFGYKRAEFVWTPLSSIELKVGAINLDESNHDLLLSGGAFIGAKESLKYSFGKTKIELSALQTNPNNRNYSNRLDEVDEGTPSFYMESLNLAFGDDNNGIKSSTSHFAFANLSNSVAGVAQYHGNSVNVFDEKNAEFSYSYIGWAQRITGKLTLGNLSLEPFSEYVVNNSAPDKNTANLVGLKTSYTRSGETYSATFSNFKSEADASVAFYNSIRYGHNNRTGNIIDISYKNTSLNFEVELNLVNSKEIEANQLESTDQDQIIALTLGKTYDVF